MLQRIGDALKGQKWLAYLVLGAPAFQVGGQFSPEAAKGVLAQAGISLADYERDLRTQARRAQLEGGIRASEFLTPAERARLAELEGQEREVRYLALPAERFKSAAGRSEE